MLRRIAVAAVVFAAFATAAPASADHFGDPNCQGQGATGSSPDDPISVAELVDLFITGPGGLSAFAGQVDEVNMLLLCAPADEHSRPAQE